MSAGHRERRSSACPSEETLSRARFDGEDRALSAHLASCDQCGERWRSMDALAQLVREIPRAEAPTSAVEAMRRVVLASARDRPRPAPRSLRIAMLLAGSFVAAGAISAFLINSAVPPPRALPAYRATVSAAGEARFSHQLHSSPGLVRDETVRVTRGRIRVEVEPLAAGERFRVVAGDAEVEVRGTAFDVEVEGDRLIEVSVWSGRVEVRHPSGNVLLAPGDRWRPPLAPPGDATRAPPPAEAPLPSPPKPERRPSLRPSPVEESFATGWRLLEAGDPAAAARAFAEAAGDPRAPLAEDARFWQGIALLRAGQREEGRRALERFLNEHPDSPRRGEAEQALSF